MAGADHQGRGVMKQVLMGFLLITIIFLTSCASNRMNYPHPTLAEESWPYAVDTQANRWAQGADRWFLTGEANYAQQMNEHAPYMAAISTMEVKVPNFTNIDAGGQFQVQIVGTSGPNRVFVYGPNDGVRQVIVEVRGNTLYLRQPKEACPNVARTIVRIGMSDLQQLVQSGPGSIEGRQLQSRGLSVYGNGSGRMYLAGKIYLCSVDSNSAGSINIFGANSTALDIRTTGSGSVNVSGRLGVRSIYHRGCGNINVIGANGGVLNIDADGSGKIGVQGCYDVCRVIARGQVCVYSYCVNSGQLTAYATDKAAIGMAGYAANLRVETSKSAYFEGRYLHAKDAYLKLYDKSHVNLGASDRVFASVNGASSVYFFGSPNAITKFVRDGGVILSVAEDRVFPGVCYAAPQYQDRIYKDTAPSYGRHVKGYRWKNGRLRAR